MNEGFENEDFDAEMGWLNLEAQGKVEEYPGLRVQPPPPSGIGDVVCATCAAKIPDDTDAINTHESWHRDLWKEAALEKLLIENMGRMARGHSLLAAAVLRMRLDVDTQADTTKLLLDEKGLS